TLGRVMIMRPELIDLTQRAREIARCRLIIAGFTGRNEDAVAAHVRELAVLGVPPPSKTPTFYELSGKLVTFEERIYGSDRSSGEVEPVLLRINGKYYLSVGSDHT